MGLRVFIRQPFTQSSEEDQTRIQGGMDILGSLKASYDLSFLTPLEAQSSDSFKGFFHSVLKEGESAPQLAEGFTPQSFRRHRLSLIDQSDAFIVLRTGLSESGAFEVAYNIFGKKDPSPLFFAVWEGAPIKTTLLRELQDMVDVTYCEFASSCDLKKPLGDFFSRLTQKVSVS